MPPTDADPLATALAAIRADGYLGGPVPRLLKAVEAAGGFHGPRETANGILVCPRCSREAGEAVRAPCPEIQAITRELTGEDG